MTPRPPEPSAGFSTTPPDCPSANRRAESGSVVTRVGGRGTFWERGEPRFRARERDTRVVHHTYPSLDGHQGEVLDRVGEGVGSHQQEVEPTNVDIASRQPVVSQRVGDLGGPVHRAVDHVRLDDDAALNRHFHAAGLEEPDGVPSQERGMRQVRRRPCGTDDRSAGDEQADLHRAYLSYSVRLSLSAEGVEEEFASAFTSSEAALD